MAIRRAAPDCRPSIGVARLLTLLTVLGLVGMQPVRAQLSPGEDLWTLLSASVSGGQLHILLRSGQELTIAPDTSHVSFDDIRIASDRKTIGWVVGMDSLLERKDARPEIIQHDSPGALVIWRGGMVQHVFKVESAFLSWAFVGTGDQVAYHAGSLHFDEMQWCGLYDAISGRKLASWNRQVNTALPGWAVGLVDP